VQRAPRMSGGERDQRLHALMDLYESRGWTSSGSADEDKRIRGILVWWFARQREQSRRTRPQRLWRAPSTGENAWLRLRARCCREERL
jgi:hypothetical protein